jgi:4-phytase/acid phosphatase
MKHCLSGVVRPLVLSFLIVATSVLPAEMPSNGTDENKTGQENQLKLVVILSRHGVRPPTWTQDRLDEYSALPWPKWDVPPGYLTHHGYELMKQFGSFDHASYAQEGLLRGGRCADAAETYIWADTDERTMESGRALAEGLFPGCPPEVHSLASGTSDPLFHPGRRLRMANAHVAKTALEVTESQRPDERQNELLVEMQRVLNGCRPDDSCTPAHAPAIPLPGAPDEAVNGNGDHATASRGSLGNAASFAEDFLLEYTEGMPSSQVGWGNVSESQLRRFLDLHSLNSDMTHRTPSAARLEASNMLFHILRTLDQGVEHHPVEDAVGRVNSKMVLLVGHDTNIAGVAALLGLHWTLDERRDDTPPGTELAFELWQNASGAYTVRVTVAMQTLKQMREKQDLSFSAPPAHQTLLLDGCSAEAQACRWEDFERIVDTSIDAESVTRTQAH